MSKKTCCDHILRQVAIRASADIQAGVYRYRLKSTLVKTQQRRKICPMLGFEGPTGQGVLVRLVYFEELKRNTKNEAYCWNSDAHCHIFL